MNLVIVVWYLPELTAQSRLYGRECRAATPSSRESGVVATHRCEAKHLFFSTRQSRMPGSRPRPPARPARRAPAPPPAGPGRPLSEAELDELQALLDRLPAPLEPLDVSMLDGFLCGVLVQPRRVPASRWLPHVTDADGRALPHGFDAARLHVLVQRRHAELDAAIERREWFDPWVYELGKPGESGELGEAADDTAAPRPASFDSAVDHDDEHDDHSDPHDDEPSAVDAVYPWVAGFVTALELFPELLALDSTALTEPLALVYRHLDADDLEDAGVLLAEIEALEPPADLSEAVEGLVRATLLLADVARPLGSPHAASRPAAKARRGPARAPRASGSDR